SKGTVTSKVFHRSNCSGSRNSKKVPEEYFKRGTEDI
ncbi:unnamed protein product, partial [Allacma fusca]